MLIGLFRLPQLLLRMELPYYTAIQKAVSLTFTMCQEGVFDRICSLSLSGIVRNRDITVYVVLHSFSSRLINLDCAVQFWWQSCPIYIESLEYIEKMTKCIIM